MQWIKFWQWICSAKGEIDDDMRYDAEVILAHQNKEYYMQNIKEITCMDSECTALIV